MRKALLCLVALQLAAVPCLADVIPTKYDETNASQKKAVESRLQDLGSTAGAAEHRVQRMSPEELAYFGAEPERIQSAGALYWYEWLGGAAFLGILAFIYFEVTND